MEMYPLTQAVTPPTSSLQALSREPQDFAISNEQPQTQPSPPQPTGSQNGNGATPSPHSLHARSCITCRRRKVKCDKKFPCSNCNKAGGECVFPAPGRAPRRPRTGGKVVSEREAELLKRLRRLEGVVEELSGQVEIEAVNSKHSPASDNSSVARERDGESDSMGKTTIRVVGMDAGTRKRTDWMKRSFRIGAGPPKTAYSLDEVQNGVGRLMLDEGKSRYLASPFWANITDEMDEIKGMLEDQEFESDSDAPIAPNDIVTEPDHQSFIMGYNSSSVDLKGLHPLPSQIPFYWQTFLENVQPLVKIMHTPTMNKVIKEVQNNLDNLEKSTEALMFSIYFAAITSLNGTEVQTNFGVDKETLLRKYRFATEQALAKASFLNTNEIVTVQAFIMFLVCVRRHDDTKFVWSLTGLALRIAQSLGLHRDGTKFGLSPFDTEMRRRLWWQVCILDTRASEDYGTDPSILDFSYDTKFPTSINDEDLDPDDTEMPVPRPGVSEMTFCLIRYEICQLTRKLTYIPPGSLYNEPVATPTFEEKERIVRECAEHLEKSYLQYCEDAGPLYWVAATVARLILAKMSLIVYHPLTQPGRPNSLSQDIKDKLFMASIEIIEYSHILESESSTKQWGWLFHTYIQWHAIAYILGELCLRSNSTIVERAWKAVDVVFADWKIAIFHTKSGMLWQPMRKLMAKARKKREENIRLQNNLSPSGAGVGYELGIPMKYVRPPPIAYNSLDKETPKGVGGNIARDRLLPQLTDTIHNPDSPTSTNIPSPENGLVGGQLHPQGRTPQIQQVFQMVNSGPVQCASPQNPQKQNPQKQNHEQQNSQQQYNNNIPPHLINQTQAQMQMAGPSQPWLLNDNAWMDMGDGMGDIEGEVNWEGWDDLVRDFQMEVDNQSGGLGGESRGPTFGGMGTWW